MPKMKTKKSVVKRFRKTATGKLKHTGAARSHLLSGKTSKRKRKMRKGSVLAPMETKRLVHLI
ncbi:MAG: 50S ribosomal protein L35 [Kiritimatiellia bacterium]|nr:50S ribosomal protein L35 [Lentisphaerota bacterium]